MPLIQSDTQAATSENIKELHHGKQFKKTAYKYGKKRAQRQAIAIAMDTKRKAKKIARKRV